MLYAKPPLPYLLKRISQTISVFSRASVMKKGLGSLLAVFMLLSTNSAFSAAPSCKGFHTDTFRYKKIDSIEINGGQHVARPGSYPVFIIVTKQYSGAHNFNVRIYHSKLVGGYTDALPVQGSNQQRALTGTITITQQDINNGWLTFPGRFYLFFKSRAKYCKELYYGSRVRFDHAATATLTTPTNGKPVSGKGEVNAAIRVTLSTDAGASCNTRVGPSGTWSCFISTTQTVGDLVVTTRDALGNTNSLTAVNGFDGATTVTVTSAKDIFRGIGEVSSTITVTTASGASCTSTVTGPAGTSLWGAATGTWSCALSGPTSQDGETYTATAEDLAGNQASVTGTLSTRFICGANPQITGYSRLDGFFEQIDSDSIEVNGGNHVDTPGSYPVVFKLTPLNGFAEKISLQHITTGGFGETAQHTPRVTASMTFALTGTITITQAEIDVGKIHFQAQSSIIKYWAGSSKLRGYCALIPRTDHDAIIDRTTTLTLTAVNATAFTGIGEVSSTITATTAGGAGCTTTITGPTGTSPWGAATGTWSCTLSGPTPQDGETYTATAEDLAGNKARLTGAFSITPLDTTTTVTLTQIGGYTGHIVQGTGEPGATVTVTSISLPGAIPCTTTVTQGGTWSCTLDISGLTYEDEQTLSITIEDVLGNSATINGKLDPGTTVTVTTPTNGQPVGGTGESDANITVTLTNTPGPDNFCTATVSSGNWACTLTTTLTTDTFTVTAVDLVGNRATATGTLNISTPTPPEPSGGGGGFIGLLMLVLLSVLGLFARVRRVVGLQIKELLRSIKAVRKRTVS